MNDQYVVPNSPNYNWLVMNTRSGRSNLPDLLLNRKKNLKAKSDMFLDALIEADSFDVPINVAMVDISAANPLESFYGKNIFIRSFQNVNVCSFYRWPNLWNF